MTEKVYQIISKHYIPCGKNEETKILWHNSLITTRTERGLIVLKVSTDPADVSKVFNYVEYFVPNSTTSPTEVLISSQFLYNLKCNIDYNQVINDPVFWPCNPALMAEKCMVSNFHWSPELFTFNNYSVLATLSNVGSVELLVFYKYGLTCDCNITKHYIKEKEKHDNVYDLNELKNILYKYASSAISWQATANSDGSCNFVTAQKNGNIVIWNVKIQNFNLCAELKSVIKTENYEIFLVRLFKISKNCLLLVFANSYGEIYGYKINSDNLSVDNVCTLWEFKDKTIVDDLIHINVGTHHIICFNKNRHLLVLLLNDTCEIVNQFVKNVNDYKIGSMFYKCSDLDNSHMLYVNTFNSKVYAVYIKIINLVLDVKIEELPLTKEINGTDHFIHGVCCSRESGLLYMMVTNKTAAIRATTINLELCTMTNKSEEYFISMLYDNPYKDISKIYECLEYVRVKVIKNRVLPAIDYDKLYSEGDTDIYKLKLYLQLLHYFLSLRGFFITTTVTIPELSVDKIKEKIFFLSAKSKVLEIHKNFSDNIDNVNFVKESFVGAKQYLKYFCDKYKVDLHKHVPMNILSLFQDKLEYNCQACDKKIEYLTCPDGHPNMFCFVTFTPIQSDEYMVCDNCSLIARIELVATNPKCILCDSFLSVDSEYFCRIKNAS